MTSVTAGVTDRSPGTRLGEGVAHDVRDVIWLNPKNSIVAPPSVQPRCVVQEITCYLQLSAETAHVLFLSPWRSSRWILPPGSNIFTNNTMHGARQSCLEIAETGVSNPAPHLICCILPTKSLLSQAKLHRSFMLASSIIALARILLL